MEENIANDKSDKGLINKIYKELIQLNIKKNSVWWAYWDPLGLANFFKDPLLMAKWEGKLKTSEPQDLGGRLWEA